MNLREIDCLKQKAKIWGHFVNQIDFEWDWRLPGEKGKYIL